MRYAPLALLCLAACGPSDAEYERRYLDMVVAEAEYERLHAKIDSLARNAPNEDSVRAILRGPLIDSVGAAGERLRAAERAYQR